VTEGKTGWLARASAGDLQTPKTKMALEWINQFTMGYVGSQENQSPEDVATAIVTIYNVVSELFGLE
jgi:hypothetical protein